MAEAIKKRKELAIALIIILSVAIFVFLDQRKQATEPCIDYSRDINFRLMDSSLDSEDNLVLLVRYGETQSFPAQEGFNNTNDVDFGVIKLDPDGEVVFSERFGGMGRDEGSHLQIDGDDNIVILSVENDKLYMTKLSPAGKQLWKKQIIDYTYSYLEVSSSGYYAIGAGISAKYNKSTGEKIWEYQTSIEDFGWFSPAWDSHTFDHNESITTIYHKSGDLYVEQVSSSGELSWNATISDIGSFEARKVIHDANNNIYITAKSWRRGVNMTNSIQDQPRGGDDGVIIKFSDNGTLTFSTYFGGARQDVIHDAITLDDNFYFLGTTESDNLQTKNAFDSTFAESENDETLEDLMIGGINSAGELMWSSYFGNEYQQFEGEYFLATDGTQIYLVGQEQRSQLPFNYVDEFDNFHSNVSRPNDFGEPFDIIISQFNQDGSLETADIIGGSSNDLIMEIEFDQNQNMILVGVTNSLDLPQVGPEPVEFEGNEYIHEIFAMELTQQYDVVWSRYLITELPFDTCR